MRREERGRRDRRRAYRLLLDGAEVARLRPGQATTISAKEGRHELQMVIDWCRSPAVAVDVVAGELTDLRCAANTSQSALWAVTIGSSEYVHLWVAGKTIASA